MPIIFVEIYGRDRVKVSAVLIDA